MTSACVDETEGARDSTDSEVGSGDGRAESAPVRWVECWGKVILLLKCDGARGLTFDLEVPSIGVSDSFV